MSFCKILARFSAVALLFLIGFNNAHADHSTDKEFVIGVEAIDYFPLYDFDHANNEKDSFGRELLTDFFTQAGYKFKFLPLPIKRFDKWLIEKDIDFKFPDNIRWRQDEREKLEIKFSGPIVELVAGSYVIESNQTMTREQVKKIGTITGFYPTLWVEDLKTGRVKLVEENNPIGIVRHLERGNVDLLNLDINVIEHNLKRLGSGKRAVLNTNLHHETFTYHLSTIHHQKILAEFTQYLSENKDKIENLKKKYLIK